jgi:hypothetical protein
MLYQKGHIFKFANFYKHVYMYMYLHSFLKDICEFVYIQCTVDMNMYRSICTYCTCVCSCKCTLDKFLLFYYVMTVS